MIIFIVFKFISIILNNTILIVIILTLYIFMIIFIKYIFIASS